MRSDIGNLKQRARQVLPGNYAALIIATIIPALIATIIETPFSNRIYNGMYTGSVTAIIIGYAGMLLISVLRSVCDAGESRMHLEAGAGRKALIADLLYAFKNRPDRYIGYYIFFQVLTTICMLPAAVSGSRVLSIASNAISATGEESYTWIQILTAAWQNAGTMLIVFGVLAAVGAIAYLIIMLTLSQTTYVLLEDMDIKVMSAVKYSANIMKGNKWALLKLYISYAGWLVLLALSLGFVSLWMMPYFEQAKAEFHLELVHPAVETEEAY